MTPRHAADRVTARIRVRWQERRARRDADDAEEASWLDVLGTPEDFKQDICGPVTKPGHRYQGPHAEPGDIPDQPAGEGR